MNVTTRSAALAAILAAAAVTASAARQTPAPQSFGSWGIDLTSRDVHVKPGDDFFAYANGAYLARTEIPSDQASTGTGRDLYNLTQEQLRTLIEASAANPGTPTATQIGNLYKSFMDEAHVEALDGKPLASDLAAIAAVTSKAEFANVMARTASNIGSSLFGLQVYADGKKPISALYLGQSGLGMPDRDYYLEATFKDKKDAYEAFVTRCSPDQRIRAGGDREGRRRLGNRNRPGQLADRGST